MPGGIVVLTVCGDNEHYRDAAQIAVRSALERTNMRIFLGVDFEPPLEWSSEIRVAVYKLPDRDLFSPRPMFLRKFETLAAACRRFKHAILMQIDADSVITTTIDDGDIDSELGDQDIAMVEQKTIIGSDHDRAFFLRHYVDHVLPWFGTGVAPPFSEFRFFNSGVVLARSHAMDEIVGWALLQMQRLPTHHRVGRHMIADQDYFQYWCNTVNPGVCGELPWYWNHCEHWDEGFPRKGGRVYHFSNFCQGPTADSVKRMADLYNRLKH